MQLFDVTTQAFRNLTPDPVSFGAGITLVAGENAQGKTNLLEAVAVLCGQRSFRNAAPAQMAKDAERFSVRALVGTRRGEERIAVTWSSEEGRVFSRSAKTAGFREISELAPAVFLAPEHRELVTGPPAARRRFLDRLVVGTKPGAGDDLARYGAALKERNALLGRWRASGQGSEDELAAWTEELAAAGADVRRHRRAALEIWNAEFGALVAGAGGDFRDVVAADTAPSDSPDEIRAACRRLSGLEKKRGHTLAGPHRDDLSWTRRGRPLAAEASAGEVARTVALARLAEWRAVAKASGEPPLFAVDDFDAGLSEASAEEFFATLPKGAAVVLTTA
ncbi:MAG TPA: DNA replication and repair protein RecF, partial [Thermoanaerobaculia bacterium]|nr:DNA replication and repair protein RecF [Thermoanaerobaculia bacterium]